MAAWVPAHLTDAQKADAANYDAGDLLQFHQNAPGHKSGSRLVVTGPAELPLASAARFEVYRPTQLELAVGDRIRVTANGKTKDGKHRLSNGGLFTVQGFTGQGDLVVDRGWVIGRDFGHVAHGYAVTSHSSQGRTVDKVFIGVASQSLPAVNQRTLYVAATRGKEQAVIFTDNKRDLLKAAERPDEPLSAIELAKRRQSWLRRQLGKHLAFLRRTATLTRSREVHARQPEPQRDLQQEATYGR